MNRAVVILSFGLVAVFGGYASGAVLDNRVEDSSVTKSSPYYSSLTECAERTDAVTCMGVRAIAALDRASRMSDIPIFDGVTLVKENDFRAGRALMTPEQLESSLPSETQERSSRLLELAYDSVLRFLQSHSLNLRMPQDAPETLQRALDEGRAKLKKKILPIALLIGAKLVTLVPLLLGAIALVALKALLVGKLALIISAVLAAQKFLGGGGLSSVTKAVPSDWSGGSGGWSSGGSYSGSGPYRRSMGAQHLAYSAQIPETVDNNSQ